MKVTQEKLPASQLGLEIEVTPEMTKQAYDKALDKFTRTVNIPGFRKGKVPRQVLIQRFGTAHLKAAALEDLFDTSLKKALEQEKIQALGNYQLKSDFETIVAQYEPGQPLTFSAAVDVQPEVHLATYTGLSVTAEEIKPDADRLTTTLTGYQKQLATLVPVEDRAAQNTDIAVVDYLGRFTPNVEGSEEKDVPGGQAENFQLELDDESRFIPGFIAGVIGMKVGETKDVIAHFPADYSFEELQDCDAKFTITLQELKTRDLPELDDEFAEEVSDGDFTTIADLTAHLEQRYQDEADDKTKENKETALLNALLKVVEVELPETLIERELNFMINQTAMQLQQQGMDVRQLFNESTVEMLKDRSRPEAIDRIKRTLALGQVAKQEGLSVDAVELEEKVNTTIAELSDQKLDRARVRGVLEEEMLKEKILAWLEANGTVELVAEGTLTPDETSDEILDKILDDASDEDTQVDIDVEAVEVVDVTAE